MTVNWFVLVAMALAVGVVWWCAARVAGPEGHRQRVEAEAAERLDAERFEVDVQRRLEAARSTAETREEV
jgi:hypothetical protein